MVIVTPTIAHAIRVARYVILFRFFAIAAGTSALGLNIILTGYQPKDLVIFLNAIFVILYNSVLYYFIQRIEKNPTSPGQKWYERPANLMFLSFILDSIAIHVSILCAMSAGIIISIFTVIIVFAASISVSRNQAVIIIVINSLLSGVFLYNQIISENGGIIDIQTNFSLAVSYVVMQILTYIIIFFIAQALNKGNLRMNQEARKLANINNILMNSVEEGIVMFDQENNIKYINDAACRFFNINYDEATHAKFFGLFPEKSGNKLQKIIKKRELIYKERLMIVIDRIEKEIQFSINTFYIDGGQQNSVFIIRDITNIRKQKIEQARATKELEQLNDELQQSQVATLNILEDIEDARTETEQEKSKIETILEGLTDAVMVLDKNKNIILFNKAAEELTKTKFANIFGKDSHSFFHFIDETSGEIAHPKFEEKHAYGRIAKIGGKLVLVRKGAENMPVAVSVAPYANPDGKQIGEIVVFRDVTIEREIDRQKTEFISVASHQLRTPLSAIKWFLEMLAAGDAGKLNTEQQDYVNQVHESNERMINLVNDLLNVSRIESGRVGVDVVPTDYAKMIESVIDELNPKTIMKKIKIKFEKPAKLQKIKLDPKLMRQAIINIIDNAIKYSPEKTTVTVNLKVQKPSAILSISDQGYGIPAKEQKKLFSKFYRGTNIIKHVTEGTGLGLYVVKSVVEAMGGSITFESKIGKGTTFNIAIPLSGTKRKKGATSLL